MDTAQLSETQCILLAVHLATEANIKALHAFTPSRHDVLDPTIVLRILLSYLPETVDPSLYTTYVSEVASRIYLQQQDPIDVDVSAVRDLSEKQARKQIKKLHIVELSAPNFPPHAPKDLLTRFLCHRAYRIDAETGLLSLVPALIEPFLNHDEYIRTWYISLILPMLRLGYEYYPGSEFMALEKFEKVDGPQGIELLLANATRTKHDVTSATDSEGTVARDLRGLVGPWMYGHTERKRRRLNKRGRSESTSAHGATSIQPQSGRSAFIALDGVSSDDKTGHDWEYAYQWLVHQAVDNFAIVTNAVEEWDGPGDVDLADYIGGHHYLEEDVQTKLERQYAQSAFASCYAAVADSSETINGAHGILVRLAQLLDFEPPPELATSVQQLPRVDRHVELLHATNSTIFLEPDVLLAPDHPLTTPKLETYMLLQMFVYTAYQLAGLGHSISIVNVAKLRFFADEDEQLALLQKILHSLASNGKRDEQQWQFNYYKLMWLWNWNIEIDEGALRGAGVFGKIDKATIEKELLKVLIASGRNTLVDEIYMDESKKSTRRITSDEIQLVILDQAMQFYDSASNGNRKRGSMKQASDLIAYAQSKFPQSDSFRRASALIAATHDLSFYSLKLQRNLPFQPVNIRVSSDPLSLLPKVLEQNPNSYTKLDDIVGIGRNLVSAGLPMKDNDGEPIIVLEQISADEATKLQIAERRVIAMCIEAALTADDFETAYSYIVNRLAPNGGSASAATTSDPSAAVPEDDVSWRAAFLAGRYRPRDHAQPTLRRLEQRTELLSLSLLLAPAQNLFDILAVWRRCDEETSALLAVRTAAEQSFDDRADRRNDIPGGFADPETEGMVFGQQRREMGRLRGESAASSGSGRGESEAPIGLFDVARGAAKAFSRNAFPLRGGGVGVGGSQAQAKAQAQAQAQTGPLSANSSDDAYLARSTESLARAHQRTDSGDSAEAAGRVRRRDMVASAVTGGLASGIGWVLGATPAPER